jgi:adenylate kinase family enzyme
MKTNLQVAVLLYGCPGCGCGTQAGRLKQTFGAHHYSMSGSLSAFVETNSCGGDEERRQAKIVAACMDEGELVPDDITVKVFSDDFRSALYREECIIVDKATRTYPQSAQIVHLLLAHGYDIVTVKILQSREDTINRLLKRGRKDDTLAKINRRCDIYESHDSGIVHFLSNMPHPDGGARPYFEVPADYELEDRWKFIYERLVGQTPLKHFIPKLGHGGLPPADHRGSQAPVAVAA